MKIDRRQPGNWYVYKMLFSDVDKYNDNVGICSLPLALKTTYIHNGKPEEKNKL